MLKEALNHVVIDSGSGTCKAGFAGEEAPRVEFPTVVGRFKNKENEQMNKRGCFVGLEAQSKRGNVNLSYPNLSETSNSNWEDMEEIWYHTFYNELKVNPEDHAVLLTEPPSIPRNRETMIQIMFETFLTPATYLSLAGVLSLYESHRTTGVVVDIGETGSSIIPVYEGYALPHAIKKLNFGGKDLTNYMLKLSGERGHTFPEFCEKEIARDLKEKLSYVPLDFDSEMKNFEDEEINKNMNCFEKSYELPNGEMIKFGNERFRCTEALFRPEFLGIESNGIHYEIYECIMKCDPCIRRDFYSNIVLSGGSTLFDGFSERIEREMILQTEPFTNIKIISPKGRKYSAWKGGSELVSLSSFQTNWISKDLFDEWGPSIVHKKCF